MHPSHQRLGVEVFIPGESTKNSPVCPHGKYTVYYMDCDSAMVDCLDCLLCKYKISKHSSMCHALGCESTAWELSSFLEREGPQKEILPRTPKRSGRP